ncbi:MAG: hypothetical protein ACR2PO_00535 [Methyloligellaceae bacterium]
MSSELEGTEAWIEALRGQGLSQEMIDQARRGAARMVGAAAELVSDPREPIAPDAYARQLAQMASAKRDVGS